MNDKIRDLGFILSLLVIIVIGTYLTYEKLRTATLEDYLLTIGDKLIAMVPEGEQRLNVTKRYEEFIRQVQDRQLEPEQVETFAAHALNLTYRDTVLSPEEIAQSLYLPELNIEVPGIPERASEPLPESLRVTAELRLAENVKKRRNEAEWEKLAVNLEALLKFDETLARHRHGMLNKRKEIYRADRGIKVVLDEDLERLILPEKLETLEHNIKVLTDMQLIIRDREARHVLIEKATLEKEKKLKTLQNALDSLSERQIKIEINSDSLITQPDPSE